MIEKSLKLLIKTNEAKIRESQEAIAVALKVLAIEAALAFSRLKKNKNKTITFCSAMGTWFWQVDQSTRYEDVHPKVENEFQRILDELGWNAIPAPIRVKCLNGEIVETLTDW